MKSCKKNMGKWGQEYIQDDRDNPYARIYCRSSTLLPKICDGTCGGCKNERAAYFEERAREILIKHNNDPSTGTGPDDDVPPIDIDDARVVLRKKLEPLETMKMEHLKRALELMKAVEAKIELLTHLAENPPLPSPEQLQ